MPKLAIVSWYLECQNEPSKPDKKLIVLPDDQAERDKLLLARYLAECGKDEITMADVTVKETKEYGDLQVSHGDIHMFVTYAELPQEGPHE